MLRYARTIHDNAAQIKESVKSGTEVFVCVARLPQSYWNELYQEKLWMCLLQFYCIRNK
jgi:hypothetical protein